VLDDERSHEVSRGFVRALAARSAAPSSSPKDVSRRWRHLAKASALPRQLLGRRELTRPQEEPRALPAESALPISRTTPESAVSSACLPPWGEDEDEIESSPRSVGSLFELSFCETEKGEAG